MHYLKSYRILKLHDVSRISALIVFITCNTLLTVIQTYAKHWQSSYRNSILGNIHIINIILFEFDTEGIGYSI